MTLAADLADYPYTTVPNAVERIFKAQCHHDRKATNTWFNMSLEQRAKQEKPRTDYLRPIIADGDTGHGGLSTVMSGPFVVSRCESTRSEC